MAFINIEFVEDELDDERSTDPAIVLERKIKALAELLECTEEEATYLFFHAL